VAFIPTKGVSVETLADAANYLPCLMKPRGRSIVVLAKENMAQGTSHQGVGSEIHPFTAQTRMSGVDWEESSNQEGSVDAIEGYVRKAGGIFPDDLKLIETISRRGTPLVVAEDKMSGVIH